MALTSDTRSKHEPTFVNGEKIMDLDTFKSRFGSDFEQARPTILAGALWDFYDRDPSNRERSLLDLFRVLDSRYGFVVLRGQNVAAGVIVEAGRLAVWAIDPTDVFRPVRLKIVIDGKVEFETETAPALDQPIYPTGYEVKGHRALELWADGLMASGGSFAPRAVWDDPSVREGLSNYLNWVGEIFGEANLRNELWTKLPDVMSRLDGRTEESARSRIPPFCRFLAGRLGSNVKLASPLSVANWIVSEVFENHDRRAIFCLTNGTLEILREPVFNRRAVKNEISLALFAFWRRHYPHVDVFSEDGLRSVQYKFATAPFVSDKNNALLVSDDLRRSLSAPADLYRTRELPWSWYWLFLLEDQGQAERMKDEKFAQITSFKEAVLDVAISGRVSFSPHAWRAYWSGSVTSQFTRFDLAVISIMANVSVPELVIAERGADYWRERLQGDFYSKVPAFLLLSAIRQDSTIPLAGHAVPLRELVIVGHANHTGLGRNLAMFVEGLAEFNPLVLSADDGSCINPDPGYNPEVGVRARVVVLCVNAHRSPEVIARFASVCEGAYVIGFYVWETDRPPESHVLGASVVDEIWTPTNYVADAYRKITSVPVHLVKKGLHPPQSSNPFLDRFRHSADEFLFLCVADFGSSIIRKNPLDAIKAFQAAFEDSSDNARLLVKIRHITPGHWSNIDGYWEEVEERIANDHRISLVEGDLTEQEYWTLIWTVDCVVSLHRSEGFGYTIADAMMAGKPVIVSDYSGSQDFCDEDNSFLVKARQTPASPEQLASQGFIGNWSTPDLEVAAEAMRRAAHDPEAREARAKAGRDLILLDYNFDQWSRAIANRLRSLPARNGVEVAV